MPQATVLKGGWSWKGEPMVPGMIIDAPSAEWIQNRVNDNNLVAPVGEEGAAAAPESSDAPAEPEAATVDGAETATAPRARGRRG